MSIIWAESFDFYGTNTANILLRGYSEYSALLATGASARTGNGYMRCSITSGNRLLTRVLDTPLDTMGIGVAQRWVNLPGNEAHRSPGIRFNGPGVVVVGNSSLGLSVYVGSTLVGSTSPNQWVLGSYYWIETKVINNNDGGGLNSGSVEVRLNGDVVLVVNGLNLAAQISSFSIGKISTSGFNTIEAWFDDLVVWDTAGTTNNNFLGDRRCFTSMPDADTAFADWVLSSGTDGFALIDELTPDDAGYIQADNPGDISEFEKEPIGIATNSIAAIMLVARALKTDAGASSIRLGVHSGAFVENGTEHNLNTTVAYFQEIFENDPNGDIPWTLASVDAATIRVTREA